MTPSRANAGRNMNRNYRRQIFIARQDRTNKSNSETTTTTDVFIALLTHASVALSFVGILVNSDQKVADSRQLVEKGAPNFSGINTLLDTASTCFNVTVVLIILTSVISITAFPLVLQHESNSKADLRRKSKKESSRFIYITLGVFVSVCAALTFSHTFLALKGEHLSKQPYCHQETCLNKDPQGTNCETDDERIDVASASIGTDGDSPREIGTISLVYSPKCGANWGHFEMITGYDLTSYRDTEFFIQSYDDNSGNKRDNKSERVRGQDYAMAGFKQGFLLVG
ncbi:DUF2690 domain-containing protein [Actinomyces slackii]|uniref:DUF2690 domain-containing protein n=1 Tax=Actinomyces slackii TaxID=52774 RepID=A0A3S4SGH5_9ACTO|nr:DUF2690 domain-containing protein [Actinomyces slackii]VEG75485.1 Uncharacterised protein [Actinomyces slackii]